MWALPFSRKKISKTKIVDSYCVLSKRRGRRTSHFRHLNDNRQEFFKYFRMGILKLENFRVVAHR